MNQIKQVVRNVYKNRKRIGSILFIVLLIPMFQNCEGGFSSGSSEAAGSGSNTGGLGTPGTTPSPGGTPTPTPVPLPAPTPTPQGPTLAEIQAACKAVTAAPSITSLSASSVTVKSGLGSANSGDQASPVQITVNANRGITNQAEFNRLNCNAQFALDLRCEVITDDAAGNPISITNAYSNTGNSLVGVSTQTALAQNSYQNNNCQVGFAVGASTATITITPNTQNQRCTEGSFSVRIRARNSVTGTAGNYMSGPQIVRVNMQNGCWNESRLKDSSGYSAVANAGHATAVNGSWAAVVAPTDDPNGINDAGSVYMYQLSGSSWVFRQKIANAGASTGENVNSVAINGSVMAVGSPFGNGRNGVVRIYSESGGTWTLTSTISPPSSQSEQDFGYSVAFGAGGRLAVAAPGFDFGGRSRSGTVYIYNSSWVLEGSLASTTVNSFFGGSLVTDGNMIAVGAPQRVTNRGQAPGSVFVFDITSRSLLHSKTGEANGHSFGGSVAMNGGRLAVGAPTYFSGTNTNQGRVYYYSTYNAATASNTKTGGNTENMGTGLAMSSRGLYVGIPFANGRAGRVDFYQHASIGTMYFRLLAYNESANSGYGWSVSASGDDVVVGARIKNDPNDNSGAGYIYRYK